MQSTSIVYNWPEYCGIEQTGIEYSRIELNRIELNSNDS